MGDREPQRCERSHITKNGDIDPFQVLVIVWRRNKRPCLRPIARLRVPHSVVVLPASLQSHHSRTVDAAVEAEMAVVVFLPSGIYHRGKAKRVGAVADHRRHGFVGRGHPHDLHLARTTGRT